jgi:hypothetical protein
MLAVHAADRRFATMFSGITLSAESRRPGQAALELKYPPGLLPALVGRLYLVAFEVAVELAGGRDIASRVVQHGLTSAQHEITWR